jgi:hypothetical protein
MLTVGMHAHTEYDHLISLFNFLRSRKQVKHAEAWQVAHISGQWFIHLSLCFILSFLTLLKMIGLIQGAHNSVDG